MMHTIKQIITQQLAGGAARTLAQHLGVSETIAKTQQQRGLDAAGLSNLLNSQQEQAQANAPEIMGMLGSMLDQNQDGSAMDDLQRMAAKFFR
jgi:hypothetical protein